MLEISSSAYVHIPFCRRRCYYCDFPITVVGDRPGNGISNWMVEYVEVVCSEIAATPSGGKPLKTVFFGGGTPSLLPLKELEQIISRSIFWYRSRGRNIDRNRSRYVRSPTASWLSCFRSQSR